MRPLASLTTVATVASATVVNVANISVVKRPPLHPTTSATIAATTAATTVATTVVSRRAPLPNAWTKPLQLQSEHKKAPPPPSQPPKTQDQKTCVQKIAVEDKQVAAVEDKQVAAVEDKQVAAVDKKVAAVDKKVGTTALTGSKACGPTSVNWVTIPATIPMTDGGDGGLLATGLTRNELVQLLSSWLQAQFCLMDFTSAHCLALSSPDVNASTGMFRSKYRPAMTITDYFYRLSNYGDVSSESMILAMTNITRLSVSVPSFVIDQTTIHRVLLTNVLIAAKFYDDWYRTNAHFANVGGISTQHMNDLEVEMLYLLNWDLYTSLETYTTVFRELVINNPARKKLQTRSFTPHSFG
jgi:hypothetical protein